jgi:hypothetical protein
MAVDFEKYEAVQVITLKDGAMLTLDEFEDQREPVDWKRYLSLRAKNAIANTFGDVDLNNRGHRALVANHNWLQVPNCGRKSYHEIMGVIEEFWPWQKRHGQGKKPLPRFHRTPKEMIHRNMRIYQDRLSGMTFKELGEKYNLHKQTINVICYRFELYGDEYLEALASHD